MSSRRGEERTRDLRSVQLFQPVAVILGAGLGQPGNSHGIGVRALLSFGCHQILLPSFRALKSLRDSTAVQQHRGRQLQITPYVFHRGDTGENSFFSNSKAEKGAQPLGTEKTHHGVAACHSQNFIKLAPVNTDNRTRFGMTLERALARAPTSSTLSGGRVFLCIFNTTRPVGSILFFHGYAVLFLDRPVARWAIRSQCASVCLSRVDRH